MFAAPPCLQPCFRGVPLQRRPIGASIRYRITICPKRTLTLNSPAPQQDGAALCR